MVFHIYCTNNNYIFITWEITKKTNKINKNELDIECANTTVDLYYILSKGVCIKNNTHGNNNQINKKPKINLYSYYNRPEKQDEII